MFHTPPPTLNFKRKEAKHFKMKATYKAAAETFLNAADWLTDEHEPAVTGLIKCAEELDGGFKAATFAQYTLTHRYLMKQKPAMTGQEDEEDDLLRDFD